MNRRYNIEEFKEITEKIRKVYKDAILTTDIIVGFPGETEEEFKTTYENLKQINFIKCMYLNILQENGRRRQKWKIKLMGALKKKEVKFL